MTGKIGWTVRRVLAFALVIVISGTSIIGYITLSLIANDPPPDLASPGWVVVVQPASESQADAVTLSAWATGSDNYDVNYNVSVCGPQPSYSANLIMSGNRTVTAYWCHALIPRPMRVNLCP